MRIVEIELINHIVIPDCFHVNLRNASDVICIDGYNGSGKTFLLNNIHPLSSNKRSNRKYAIIKGREGLKRIVYELSNNVELEIIHEYTASGKTHSCKSYCNLYDNGVKTQLNPTGHTENFESIIKDYLHFDLTTFVSSFINNKGTSVVNATPAKRMAILKSTINNMSVLSRYQNNSRELLADTRSLLKVYKTQREELFNSSQYKSVNDYNEAIINCKTELISLQMSKEDKERNVNELNKKLGSLNNITDIGRKIETLKTFEYILNKFTNNITIEDIMNNSKSISNNLLKADYKSRELKDRIEVLSNKIRDAQNFKSLEILKKSLDNQKDELKSYLSNYTNEINERVLYELQSISNRLTKILEPVFYKTFNIPNDLDSQNIDKYISEVDSMIDEEELFGTTYKEKYELVKDMIGQAPINTNENCSSCKYYNKFEVNIKYINDNTERHEALNETLGRLYERQSSLSFIKRTLVEVSNIHDTISNIIKVGSLADLSLESLNKCVINNTTAYSVMSKITKELDDIIMSLNRYVKISKELSDVELQLAKSSNSDLESMEYELKGSIENLEKCKKYISDNIEFKEITDNLIVPDISLSSNLYMITCEIDRLANINKHKMEVRNDIDSESRDIRNLELQLSALHRKVADLDIKKSKLEETSKHLVQLQNDATKYSIIKDILEKRIPLKLLSENTEFIELTVNSIMEENEIPLSIEVVIEDTDIRIPVMTRNNEVDDVADVSSGEYCLLAITLSSAILHIIGYNIIMFDELTANLDVVNKDKFHNILQSILQKLDIMQIFCISHEVSVDMATSHIVLGNYDTGSLLGEILSYN